MINIKTKQDIIYMQKAADILKKVKQKIWDAIKPGVSTEELDQIAYQEIIKQKAQPAFLGYNGFPKTCCISINEELIHGIPSRKKIIKNGDLVSVDIGVIYKGYFSDSAFTKGVGKISKIDQKLIDVAKGAFWAGVNAIKPGAKVGDIEYAIGQFISQNKFYTPENFSGHGIGKKLHEEPAIYNSGIKNTGEILKNGMVICIEPMILQNSSQTITLKDQWTIISHDKTKTSHYEHTILIYNNQAVILTEGI